MDLDIEQLTEYIRRGAVARGMNPATAAEVARREGLQRGTWQSNSRKNGIREPSYSPFQLLVGGPGTGFPAGLGNDMINQTGVDPRDPANVYKTIDFSLDTAKADGWRKWMGAKAAGIGRWDGIRQGTPGLTLNSMPVMDGPKGQETLMAPPLPPPTAIGDMPIAAAPPPSPMSVFKDDGILAGLKALGGTDGGAKGMGLLGSAMGGGEDAQAKAHATPIGGSLAGFEAADSGRMAAASQLMAQLLAAKRKVPGRTLMG